MWTPDGAAFVGASGSIDFDVLKGPGRRRTVEFQLLGPVRARHDGTAVPLGRRRERCLLAVLLLEVGSVVPAERLIDLLWDGEPSPAARDNLRAHVSRLRQHVDPEG